jgi:hypothetical protein
VISEVLILNCLTLILVLVSWKDALLTATQLLHEQKSRLRRMNELGACIFLKVHVPILLVNNHGHGLS